jgi:uracil phosphoribosyltransferase
MKRQLRIIHPTSQHAALLLSTLMRDANIAGSALREAHRQAGWYLATQYLSCMVGLEEHAVPHVQGHMTTGYRIRNETKTCIIPLMRGGEPMAFGVSEVLPLATFVHAKQPEDIDVEQLEGISTVVLVDAVVNTGKRIVDFVHHVKRMKPSLLVVIVAGTVHMAAISESGSLTKPLEGYGSLSVVALRVADNKFTATKGTDTGNRLFNTTHLD